MVEAQGGVLHMVLGNPVQALLDKEILAVGIMPLLAELAVVAERELLD